MENESLEEKAEQVENLLVKSKQGNALLGYFNGNQNNPVQNAKILIIGYGFENDVDMDRSMNLAADLENIKNVFGKYNVESYNLIGQKKELLLEYLEKDNLSKEMKLTGPIDLLILFVLSHGGGNGLIFTDIKMENGQYESIHKKEIWDKLAAVQEFENAIKIYFMGPCRGSESEAKFLSGSEIEKPLHAFSNRPNVCMDLLMRNHVIFYSAVEGTTAITNSQGSWMVQSVCGVLQGLEKEISLEVFLTRVIRKIVRKTDINASHNQTPEMVMLPHTHFTFRQIIKTEGAGSVTNVVDSNRIDYYSWKTEKGEKLAPGVAYIFHDEHHRGYVEHFEKCFTDLGLEVHKKELANITYQLREIATNLDEEGMMLVCCLCKLVETETGDLNLSYNGLREEQRENISSVTGLFTGLNCPKMSGRAKVIFFLDSGIRKDDPIGIQKTIVMTTNDGNNHSDSICLYAKGNGNSGFCEELIKFLSQGEKSLQENLRELINSSRLEKAVVMSTMPCLLDFPQIDPIYMEPTFQVESRSEEQEMEFDELINRMKFLRRNNNLSEGEGPSRIDSFHQGENSSVDTCGQPTPGSLTDRGGEKSLNSILQTNLKLLTSVFSKSNDTFSERTMGSPSLSKYSDKSNQDNKYKQIVVVSSPAGSGKTKTTKEITKCLRNLQIDVCLFALKECDDLISKSKNLNEFLKKYYKEKIDMNKTAIIFDGVDEICPYRRSKLLLFIKQAAENFGFVLITTRPQEEIYIRDTLESVQGKDVLWLSIKEFAYEESNLFLRRLLKGVDCELILEPISRYFPRTPQVLKMIAELLKNDDKRKILSEHLENEFIIYWHIVDLHVKQAKKKHEMRLTEFDVVKYLIDVAVRVLVKREEIPKVDKDVKDTVNEVGIASFNADGKVTFDHKTYCEFLVCLGFLISPEDVPVFIPKDKVSVLLDDEFGQVRLFLEQAFKINLNDECFQEANIFANDDLLKAIHDEDKRFIVLYQVIECEMYSTFLRFNLESFNLIKKEKNELLFILIYTDVNGEKLLKQFGEICDILVKNGADLAEVFHRLCEERRKTFVYYLAVSNSESIKSLVEIIKEDKYLLNTAFVFAVRFGHLEHVKMLLSEGADVKATLDTRRNCRERRIKLFEGYALHVAAFYGHKEVFDFFLRAEGMHINLKSRKDGYSPLLCAARGGQMEMLQFLLNKPGVNIQETDYKGMNVLHHAAYGRNVKIVKYLHRVGFDINVKSKDSCMTALHFASENNHDEMVEYLLENSADINAINKYQETALHIAADRNNSTIVKRLLKEENLIVNAKSYCGRTALHYAVENNSKEILLLLMHKINVNTADNEGNTPLHKAAQKGLKNMVKILVENEKVQVNALNEKGETALHIAAAIEHIDWKVDHLGVIRFLLTRHESKLHIQTALNMATNPDIIKILQSRMD